MTAVVSESESGIFIIPRRETDTGRLREEQQKELARHVAATMKRAYNEDELAQFCFDIGIDYESLSGDTKQAKIRSLVLGFYRQKTLDGPNGFASFLEGDRPKYVWRLTPDGEQG